MKDIVFSKEEVLSQFNTKELIADIVTRNDENLNKLIEAYIITGVILKCKLKIDEELKKELIEKLERCLED